jgi:hypothetical protein
MNAPLTTDTKAIANLIKSESYKALHNLCRQRLPTFNLFDELEQVFHENCASRLFRFLFDSSATHGLGTLPVRALTACLNGTLEPNLKHAIKNAHRTVAQCEWGTPQGRFMDILIAGYRRDGRRSFVIGIENKHGAVELPDQLRSYQGALDETYGTLPKALLFLSPTGSPPTTAESSLTCPVIAVSHSAMCFTLKALADKPVAPALAMLLNACVDKLTGDIKMQRSVEKLIVKLLRDPDHRKAIGLIRTHAPSVSQLLESLTFGIGRGTTLATTIAWTYPSNNKPHEINFDVGDINAKLKKKKILREDEGIYYMLKCGDQHQDEVTVGDKFDVLLMLRANRNRRDKIKSTMSPLNLPPQDGVPRRWGPWTCLWAGTSHVLKDLGDGDVREMVRIVREAVGKTYPVLMKHAK